MSDQLDIFQQTPEREPLEGEAAGATRGALASVPPVTTAAVSAAEPSSRSGQLVHLPGTTFEDIFQPPEAA